MKVLAASAAVATVSQVFPKCSQSTLPYKPNLIFISLEDLSACRLKQYGNVFAVTPNIDNFALDAVQFGQMHVQCSLCTPSRSSMLTGVRPSTTGLVQIQQNWREAPGLSKRELGQTAIRWPKLFKDNGYYTYRVGKINDSRDEKDPGKGFFSIPSYLDYADEWDVSDSVRAIDNNDKVCLNPDNPIGQNRALEKCVSRGQPFLLAIGYTQCHTVQFPSNSGRYTFMPTPEAYDHPMWESVFDASYEVSRLSNRWHESKFSHLEIRDMHRRYWAVLYDVDKLIGQVIQRTKQLGIYDSTIIMIGSDHGLMLGEGDIHASGAPGEGNKAKWGKGECYDLHTHVPFWIRIPGNPNNGTITQCFTELVDIYSTMIDYCHLFNPPQELQGDSLRPLLENPFKTEFKKAIFCHQAYNASILSMKTKVDLDNGSSLDVNYIRYPSGERELYDRTRDPWNITNIIHDVDSRIIATLDERMQYDPLRKGGDGWRGCRPN